MNRVVIGIGSNIDPQANVRAAVEAIAAGHRLLAESAFVQTEAIGRPHDPPFLNGAVLIETQMDADALKRWLRELEAQLGRRRGPDRCAPRTIDLDIVVLNGEIVDWAVRERDFLRTAVREVLGDVVPDDPS